MLELVRFLKSYPDLWSKLKVIPKRDKSVTNRFEVRILETNKVIYSSGLTENGNRSAHAASIDDKLEILENIEDAMSSLTC